MRNSHSIRMFAPALLAAFVGAVATLPARAAPPLVEESTEIRYDDLDLDKAAGVERLYARLRAAAEKVCAPRYRPGTLFVAPEWRACMADALEQAVAEHLNFTRAGEALGVTPGAASQQIRALEEYLSRALFRRNGRVVTLTAEGAALLPRVQHALGELERALAETRGDRSGGPLRVSMLASFLQNWLLPRLPRLRARHPNLNLQVHTSEAAVDLVRDDHHAAIRFGAGHWPGLFSEKLLDEWLVPVCAPALYRKHGPLRRRDDLARYPLVHSTSEPWTAWLLASQVMDDDTTSPFTGARIDDSAAVVRLAVQGLGLALARWSLAADDVAAGRLAVASPKPLQMFRDWLVAELAELPRPPGL